MICFGPVTSRRLGKSLGINNIIAPKRCSFGCVYCQAGRTIRKSIAREQFYRPDFIYDEVYRHLESISEENYPDYLTFVSLGEPTLDASIAKSLILLRDTGIKLAVITNSSLLSDTKVREDISTADLVSLKMDTVSRDSWRIINNPAHGLDFDSHLSGISQFAKTYNRKLITETMLVNGLNDSDSEIKGVATFICEIKSSKSYIAIPIRPPAEKWVKPPDHDVLNRAWQVFDSMGIDAELLTGYEDAATGYTGNAYEDILNITAVHPLREDAVHLLLRNDNAEFSVVESLISQHLIRTSVYNGKRFFIRDYHNRLEYER